MGTPKGVAIEKAPPSIRRVRGSPREMPAPRRLRVSDADGNGPEVVLSTDLTAEIFQSSPRFLRALQQAAAAPSIERTV